MSSSRQQNSTLVLALLAMAALLVGAFFVLFEPVEEEIDVPASGLASRNRWYAAELMLGELGVPTTSRYGLGVPPPADHVIVLLADHDDQRRPMAPRLRSWVESGGHLVVVPAREQTGFSLFGFDFDEEDEGTEEAEEVEEAEEAEVVGAEPVEEPPQPATHRDTAAPVEMIVAEPDQEDPENERVEDALLAAFGLFVDRPRVSHADRVQIVVPGRELPLDAELEAAADFTWEGEGLAHAWFAVPVGRQSPVRFPVLQRPVGPGQVSVVSDSAFFENHAIGELDHALLLAEIIRREGALPAGALLVLTGDSPSILRMLSRSGWPALIGLGVLALAWGRAASRRFGPLQPEAAPARRRLLEHVEATGHFLWRLGRHEVLLAAARRQVRARLGRRHPGLGDRHGAELIDGVAERLGMLPDDVREAFYGGGTRDRRSFVQAVRALQRIWRHP